MAVNLMAESGTALWSSLRPYVAKRLALLLDRWPDSAWALARELRLRAGRSPRLLGSGGELELGGVVVGRDDLGECLGHLTQHSLYAWEEELQQGFLTLPGGHRVGLAGRVLVDRDGRVRLREVGGLNYRLARSVDGVCQAIAPLLRADGELLPTLLLGPPGSGKTTVLRDLVRAVSDGIYGFRPQQVVVVDERSEVAACRAGVPGRPIGARTDVLDGCPKAVGMTMAVRSLGPQVLATDELGDVRDAAAVLDAAHAGVSVLATAHARDLREFRARAGGRLVVRAAAFRRFVVLSPTPRPATVRAVQDEQGRDLRS